MVQCVKILLCTLATLFLAVFAVDRGKFRTCAQTGFCSRLREKVNSERYQLLVSDRLKAVNNHLIFDLKPVNPATPLLRLDISFVETFVPRIRITEAFPLDGKPRWESKDILVGEPTALALKFSVAISGESILIGPAVATPEGEEVSLYINILSLQMELKRGGKLAVSLNPQGMFHFEHTRRKGSNITPDPVIPAPSASVEVDSHGEVVDYTEAGEAILADGTILSHANAEEEEEAPAAGQAAIVSDESLWTESFGSHTDTKADGPQAVSMDFTFHGASVVYGIPEHASSMALKPTWGEHSTYNEPYRLYNLDVFEYELDVPMALYGSIPFMLSHGSAGTHGMFWLNPSETFIDVASHNAIDDSVHTHWMSESGVLDIFLFTAPSPKHILRAYARLTGPQALPPLFATAYHQCRWNYKDEQDVSNVHGKFEEHDFPYDVLWLDIEHTDGKRYFTWDSQLFPSPLRMQQELAETGRKMVTIVDPHMKRDNNYKVHKEATANGFYIKRQGSDFDGWCWPGSSSYLDFTTPEVRAFWAGNFRYDSYLGSSEHLFTWNDMNEPSVFNGPEVSMHKDCVNRDGVEHRHWHNLYGFYQQMATADGLVQRNSPPNQRPFVLSRAFFAGSQRYGAIWTGDNKADWSHLAIATPMLLTQGLAGLPFSGADVGGFFGNPDEELLVRWYQAGSYQPFFRAHAHIDSKRREPWLFSSATLERLKSAVKRRYALLPFIYTVFREASITGSPVMRPLWYEYPTDPVTWRIDDQFLVGRDILVKPVTAPGQLRTSVYVPAGVWYYSLGTEVVTVKGGQAVDISTPLDFTPELQRGGSIVPTKNRLRRSSALMRRDPYTLNVALDTAGTAYGELYIDDEVSFDYQEGIFAQQAFTFQNGALSSKNLSSDASGKFVPANVVERILVTGLRVAPTRVTVSTPGGEPQELQFVVEGSGRVVIKKPAVAITAAWTVLLV